MRQSCTVDVIRDGKGKKEDLCVWLEVWPSCGRCGLVGGVAYDARV